MTRNWNPLTATVGEVLGPASAPEPRPLYVIAREIVQDWERPNYAAVPYLEALADLDTVADDYYYDSGRSVVLYFLSNAGTWRGETARRIKAELKALL
jgi:hypothetical protein